MSRSSVSLRSAALAGVVAFVVGDVAMLVLAQLLPLATLVQSEIGVMFGHVMYYDAHNPLATFALSGSNLWALSSTPVKLVGTLLPIAVITLQANDLVSGAAASYRRGAAIQGASVVVGYLPVAALGLVPAMDWLNPLDMVLTLAVYPVVFGALGGLIAHRRAV
jgi:hypothetical protein